MKIDWIYRLANNPNFPEPVGEAENLYNAFIKTGSAYLLLIDTSAPPMSGARPGEKVAICITNACKDGLRLLATAEVMDSPILHNNAPNSASEIYGPLSNRIFCEIKDVQLFEDTELPHSVISQEEQERFVSGQATVRRV